MTRLVPSLRLRTVALTALFSFTTFFVQAAPSEVLPRPEALTPQTAQALACADGPSFEGKLTSSSSTTALLERSTTGNVYGYISDVIDDWSCTAWYRYDGLAWARDDGELDGNFDWGNLINSTSVPCNWDIHETNYLKANSTNDCADSDAEYAMPIFLGNTSTSGDLLEWVFHQDSTPDEPGDFAFIHSDCETYYGGEEVSWNQPFTTSQVGTRPGNNCDPYDIDGTNTTQALVVDATAPSTNIDWPSAGTTVIPSTRVVVKFEASDEVAGFGDSSHDWDLKKQRAAVGANPGTCDTTWTDISTQSGASSDDDHRSNHTLVHGWCWRWTLAATDANGNAASLKTSGAIRVDAGISLGQPSWNSFEDWDLGGGDTLAVNVANDNVVIEHPLVSLPIRGSSLDISLVYNSLDPANLGLGGGWRLDKFRGLTINADSTVTFTDGGGGRHTFTAPSVAGTVTTYTRPVQLYANLVKDTTITANEFILTYRDGSKDKFDISGSSGLLVREEDRFGNGVTLAYSAGKLSTITDTVGSRSVSLNWSGAPAYLVSLTDWANVSSGVVQNSGSGNRVHRFFNLNGRLIGWADPLNTSDTCGGADYQNVNPSSASHLTCVNYPSSAMEITKTQTVTTLSSGVLSTSARTSGTALKTLVTFSSDEVASVKSAQEVADGGSGTIFSHPLQHEMRVVRDGDGSATLDTTTEYDLVNINADTLGRVAMVSREFHTSPTTTQQIDTLTEYDGTYLIEPASISENDFEALNTPRRITTYEYVGSSLGLLLRVKEPIAGSDKRWTEYVYNPNSDVALATVSLNGGATKRVTKTCYTSQSNSCATSENGLAPVRHIENWISGGAVDEDTNVATDYTNDSYGQRTSETRRNYSAAGSSVDNRETAWQYGTSGNAWGLVTQETVNVNGSSTYDATPDANNARTNLRTKHEYDTAGNPVRSADPRCTIDQGASCLTNDHFVTTWTYDALDQALTEESPTTPNDATAQKTATSTFDELGGMRSSVDFGDRVNATAFDRSGRAIATFEDSDGAGGAAAVQTSSSTVDPQGRVISSSDQRQLADPSGLGATRTEYDDMGRTSVVIEAYVSGTPLSAQSTTEYMYDGLDRMIEMTSGIELGGDAQTTVTTYDLGGRAVSVNDEFTCATSTVNYLDQVTQTIEGRVAGAPCTGAGTRTINQTFDGVGRVTARAVASGPTLEATTFDAVGRAVKTWSTSGSVSHVVETTFNILDEPTTSYRYTDTSGTKSLESWSRANRDPAGNETDRCSWTSTPAELCHPATDTSWANPLPISRSTSTYDALNQRIALSLPDAGTTTYDPDANYQVDKVYVTTKTNGTNEVIAEHQTDYGYDGRDRLISIDQQACVVTADTHTCTSSPVLTGTTDYTYDDNDNRVSVVEDNGSGAVTRYYCYDARNQLVKVSSGSSTCASAVIETFTFDAAGNRLTDGGRAFTYDAQGQLASCTSAGCGTPTFDADGRLTAITAGGSAWTYIYDDEGRLVTACKANPCSGTPARLDFTYDGSGHRIRIVETPSGASPTTMTTNFAYDGNTVISETATSSSGPITTRTFTTDEAGAIHKMTVVTTGGGSTTDDGTYLIAYNGHGDAIGLAEIDATDGHLTPAARIIYSTWGTPTVTAQSGYGALGFRYLYVGRFDVQWDDFAAAGLHFMHARHYSPEFGRFLQPDPSRLDANLFGYAGNSPVTKLDPTGNEPMAAEEWLLAAWYPRHGRVWMDATFWAFSSTRASQLMGWMSKPKENAMRHCVWQCMITANDSWRWAEIWGAAHEIYADNHSGKADTTVDYHNNYVGRLLGSNLPMLGGNVVGAFRLCSDAWDRGWLFYRRGPRIHWSDGRREYNPSSGPTSP